MRIANYLRVLSVRRLDIIIAMNLQQYALYTTMHYFANCFIVLNIMLDILPRPNPSGLRILMGKATSL